MVTNECHPGPGDAGAKAIAQDDLLLVVIRRVVIPWADRHFGLSAGLDAQSIPAFAVE